MTRSRPVHIVVLGGGYAGVLAARRLAAGAGRRARVTLVNASDRFVERIRLHEVAAGQAGATRPLAPLLGGATLRVGRVRALDVARRRIVLDDGALDADYVVNALGSAARKTAPGVAAHALVLDDPDRARAVGAAARAAAARGEPIAIVGGGLTAIELATELPAAIAGLRVLLYCRGALGEGTLGEAAAAHARAALARAGVAIHEHADVARVEADAIVLGGAGGARVPVAATVWCAGFAASPLAAEAGLAVDWLGRMLVDDTLAVPGVPWLFGAGDAAVPTNPVGAPIHMACKTAMPMAARAADNLLAILRGEEPRPFRFGDTGVCVSLGRRDGVIQHRDARGAARGVTRGWLGARLKETVCRFTVRALRFPFLQRVFALYARRGARVLAAGAAPAALPAGDPTP